MDYHQAVGFLESLSNVSGSGRKSKKAARERLNSFKHFLEFLGNPENKLKIIHIAGTSGKGSVVAMLHGILQSAGKRVGSYTSPHTTTLCERIKVGDKYIGGNELARSAEFLKNKMDEYARRDAKTLNFFEVSFCLALLYFKKMNCEYAVIETGCGGRYDATNAIRKPIYAIITNIGPDHLDVIGPTLKDIAYEKAGIIKAGAAFLNGETNRKWQRIFENELKKIGTRNARAKSVDYEELKNIKIGLDGTQFEYKGGKYNLKLLGEHQARNAALAIECAKDLKISERAIRDGLLSAFYAARMEIISRKPLIIIDGAHNEDKLKAALKFLNDTAYAPRARKYLIMAMARNKKTKILPEFFKYFTEIYFTRFSNPFRKCLAFSDWRKIAMKVSKNRIKYRHLPQDALLDILPKLGNNDLLLITGSIFLAGELREHWCPEDKILKSGKSFFRA